MVNPIKIILKRNIGSYVEIFAGDDKKKGGFPVSSYFKIEESNFDKIINEAETLNYGDNGVFFNINPLKIGKRNKENVLKITNIFIDLDDGATEIHNDLVISNLNEMGISYYYNAQSGHGYHFLIPVDLETTQTQIVKGFLTYLKENVLNKIDVATHTNERLMRFPESLHNKDENSKQLKTLLIREPNEIEIKQNNQNILKYQLEQRKGEKDIQYLASITKEDIFFSTILNNTKKWSVYYSYLNKALNRNDYFIKHLGNFVLKNKDYENYAVNFLKKWEPSRVSAMEGWIKAAVHNNYTLNYYELLKWSKDNSITEWVELLQEQLKTTFLDSYEVYYLEDEKTDSSYLLYYPDKNYYVQKTLNEVLMTIYYDCKEIGIDLILELKLELIKNWETIGFKKQLEYTLRAIHRVLDNQNRIKMVLNINYKPDANKFVYYNNKKYFNTYAPSSLWEYNKPSNTYNFPLIKELVHNLTGDEQSNYNYFNKWLAWLIQNPTDKLPTAIILQGQQGSGKGTFKNLILDKIFGENCIEINQTHLESSFNEYLLGKQIIVANEVMHNENRQTLPNILKNLVTDWKITISRKFRREIEGHNYTHWIFCTNSDNPIKIDDDDRRYSVFYSKKLRLGLVKQLILNLDYELKEYLSYLKSLDVEFEEISEPIMTDAKKEIIELNKSSIDRFLEYLKQFNDLNNALMSLTTKDYLFKLKEDTNGINWVITDTFYLAYEVFCDKFNEKGKFNKHTFSKRLSNKGLKNNVVYFPDRTSFRSYHPEELLCIIEK